MKLTLALWLSALFLAGGLLAQKPIVEGRADSTVRAVIYEDLQCPDCAAFCRMMDEKLLPEYGGKVAFVHRDFPLAKHAWARRAAIAARFFTDRKPELGLEYRRYTMAGQEATNDANFNMRLADFAKAHDIEPDAAVAALSNARYAEVVEQDYQDGVSRGVVHTPTVFVNGKPFVETFRFEEISKGIDQADRKSTRLNSSHSGIAYALFCWIRGPPRSTLFPYTTLFRSVHTPTVFVNGKPFVETFTFEEISKGIDQALAEARSEEHTSELQSLRHLVCRLLLA